MRGYLSVIGLLIAIFGSIALYVFSQFSAMQSAEFAPPPVTIAAAIARQEVQQAYLDAVGTVKAIRGIELTSESNGEITALHFDSGDEVKAGQLLLVLNDEIEQASRLNQIASRESSSNAIVGWSKRILLPRHNTTDPRPISNELERSSPRRKRA